MPASLSERPVEVAALAVGARSMITSLPGGYRHPVTGRGRNRSAGQWQLIALARAELLDPDIHTTAERADRVVVLYQGCLVEDGSQVELVTAGGPYARLWQAFTAETRAVPVDG